MLLFVRSECKLGNSFYVIEFDNVLFFVKGEQQ